MQIRANLQAEPRHLPIQDGKERPALPQESHSICAGRPEKNTRGRAAEAEGTGSAQQLGPAKFDPDFGTESSGITESSAALEVRLMRPALLRLRLQRSSCLNFAVGPSVSG